MIGTQRSVRRQAFTLIELLVVMSIVALIGTLGYMFFPSMSSRTMVDAANRVQGWLLAAKQQAKRDNRPTGIRFLVSAAATVQTPMSSGALVPSNDSVVNTLRYIQQPDDFVGPAGSVCSCAGNSVTFPNNVATDFLGQTTAGNSALPQYITFANTASDQTLVQAGDYIEFNRCGHVYPILSLQLSPAGSQAVPPTLSVNLGVGGTAVTGPTLSYLPYRIIRQPRCVLAEPDLVLPGNSAGQAIDADVSTLIDVTSYNPTSHKVSGSLNLPPARTVNGRTCHEILFGPSGAVVGPAASSDMICLWLCNESGSVPPVLVCIRTRTGLIGVFPVNENPSVGNGDPYYFARDARASGM